MNYFGQNLNFYFQVFYVLLLFYFVQSITHYAILINKVKILLFKDNYIF